MMASIRKTRTAGHAGRALAGVALVLALAPGWATAEPTLAARGDANAAALPPLLLPAQWSQVWEQVPVPMPGQVPEQASAVDAGRSSSGSAPTEVALWWRGFGDRELMARVEQALQANTSVRSARAALEQARALRDVAQAGRWPEVGASASVQRSRSGDAAVGNSWRAGLDAAWDPDLAGRQRAGISAGEAELQAARYGLEQARVELAAEVALSYIELRGLQARLAIARANLAAQQDTLQITDWRVQAGLASSLDLEQARAATEQTRAQIPALRTSLSKTAHALALLGGQMPVASQTLLETVRPVPLPPTGLVLSFPAETLRQRADLRAAEQRVLAALARVEQADAARWPSFQLAGSLGLAAARPADLFELASLTRTLLAGLSASLFDGGAARAQVRAQQAALEQSRIGYEAALLGALQQVEDALAALAGDRERLVRLQAAAEAAANAELLARQRYASGLIDFRTVLDTQRTLLSAQSELETTRAALSADHVRLYLALGGGWTPDAAPQP